MASIKKQHKQARIKWKNAEAQNKPQVAWWYSLSAQMGQICAGNSSNFYTALYQKTAVFHKD